MVRITVPATTATPRVFITGGDRTSGTETREFFGKGMIPKLPHVQPRGRHTADRRRDARQTDGEDSTDLGDAARSRAIRGWCGQER